MSESKGQNPRGIKKGTSYPDNYVPTLPSKPVITPPRAAAPTVPPKPNNS